MKRLIGLFAVVVLFSGCRKILDIIQGNDDDPASYTCRVTAIHTDYDFMVSHRRFYYNHLGDPDSIVFDNPGTGSGGIYITYDNKKRLKKVVNHDVGTYWYYYEGDAIWPTRDTLVNIFSDTFEGAYFYDNQGRLSKVEHTFIAGPTPPAPGNETNALTYEYDGNGNLYSGGDDKINYLRTSKVLQFLFRDYSVNNARVADRYNEYGFPEYYDYSNIQQPGVPVSEEIEYSCR